jgi:DNA-binding CsgD family transcriptional regulator
MLYQLGALGPAAERVFPLARASVGERERLSAFCRLTEIACDKGELDLARGYLAEMQRVAGNVSGSLSAAGRAELNYAVARYAFSRRDGAELEQRARDAVTSARETRGNVRIVSLAIRINSYLAVDQYHRRDLAGAFKAAATASKLLRATPGVLPYVRTHGLTTQAVMDLHDPTRAHLAIGENVEALELALANGMTSTAQDALFNIVNFWLYCDVPETSPYETRVVRESLEDAIVAPTSSDDPVLAALSLCCYGRHAEAAALLDRIAPPARERGSEWLSMFFGPVTATKRARILFKAGEFVEAERAASDALRAWEQSRLGGQGIALRVRAEALEALGDRRNATAAVEDAIGSLEPIQAVHHMLGAYQCGHRLTKKSAYLDHSRDLISSLKKAPRQTGRLTPREREIAALVARGQSNKAIAAQLNLSRRTVENRVASIFTALAIRARWQLTEDALHASLVPRESQVERRNHQDDTDVHH